MTNPADIPADIYEQADILCDQFRCIDDDREFLARCLMSDRAGRDAGLTERQAGVLNFIRSYSAEHGFSPNYMEMADGLGLKSKSRICDTIDQLEQRGFVQRMSRRARSIKILDSVRHVSAAHKISAEA